MSCEELIDLLPLYCADALSGDERDVVDAHLSRGCPACAGRIAELDAALAQLPLALEPMSPSPHVKARLMARIAEDRAGRQSVQLAGPAKGRSSGNFARLGRLAAIGVALGLVLLVTVASATVYIALNNSLRGQAMEIANLKKKMARRDEQISDLQGAAREASRLRAAIESESFDVVPLEARAPQPNAAWGRVLWDRDNGDWIVIARGLRAPSQGQTYQLWFVPQSAPPVPLGRLVVTPEGSLNQRLALPGDLGPLLRIVVTEETELEPTDPTGAIQLSSQDRN